MAEVLVHKIKFKEGEFRVFVDSSKKLIRDEWTGKCDEKELEEAANLMLVEIRKFPKGEPVYLHDATKVDLKLWTPAQIDVLKRVLIANLPLVKKFATVYASFIHQKSTESTGAMISNHKIFTSIPEAMKWLMEG